MHFTLDRSVAAIAVTAVVFAFVLLYIVLMAPPKLPAEVWPNVTGLFN